MSTEAQKVPFLLTMDLEIAHDHNLSEQTAVLSSLCRDLAVCRLPLTIFTTATAAEAFAPDLRELLRTGNEIACHGLTHGPEENFVTMSECQALATVTQATERIASAAGSRPRCFRGPSMMTSATVQKVLIQTGYLADFSVCPQRLDLLTCRGATLGWLQAPRLPYRPSPLSPFRRGSLPLVVVPLNSAIVPFISGVLYLLGLRLMELLFQIFLCEARRTGGVIVYQFHSYEFTHFVPTNRDLRPLHQRLYPRDPARCYALNRSLLAYIARQPVAPMSASAFVEAWKRKHFHGHVGF